MDFFAGTMMLPDGTRSARLVTRLMGVVGVLESEVSIADSDTFTYLNPNFPAFVEVIETFVIQVTVTIFRA
jgi:hypothetical protein